MKRSISVRGTLLLGVAYCLASTASSALAQQSGESDPDVVAQGGASSLQQAGVQRGGLQDIVVTARRSEERSQDVPISITTVSGEDLQKFSMRDVAEIQKVTPGLYMSSQNSAGRVKITIRGQSEADSRLTTDPSVGVYIDGINYTRTYGLRSSFVDLAQVEVLKGPQGTLFGKNTTGGAINITTQHPKYQAEGYADLLYGSYNNMQALGVINLPIVEDRLAIRAVGQVISRDGYGSKLDGQDIGDDHVVTGRLLLRADPAENVRIFLSGDYTRQRNTGANVILTDDSMLQNTNSGTGTLGSIAAELGLDPTSEVDRRRAYDVWRGYYDGYSNGSKFQSGFATDPRGIFDDVDHWGVSGEIAVDVGDITIKSITAYRHLNREYIQDLDGTPFSLLQVHLGTDVQNFSQELQVSSIDGTGLDWQFGAYYNRESGNELSDNNTNSYVSASRSSVTDTDSLNKSAAVYGQAVLHLTDSLRMTGGLRYTEDYRGITSHSRIEPSFAIPPAVPASAARCNQLAPEFGGPVYPHCNYETHSKFDQFTWLASVDWKPAPDLLVYGSVNKGYRAGGYTAQAFSRPLTPDQLEQASNPFQPEKVIAYEVGFKSDLLGRTLRVNGAAFYQDYTNIQQQIRDYIDGNSVTLIRNAAAATLWGGELEVVFAPTDATMINLGVSYLSAEYDEYIVPNAAGDLIDLSGAPFPAPEVTFNIGATQTVPLSDGELRFSTNFNWIDDVVYRAEAKNLPSVTQGAFGLLDARISWRIHSQDLEISIFGKNLTDKRYIQAASNSEGLGFNYAFPGDPRVFGIQVRKNF